jgi:voltage-gated potassium channel
VIDVNPLTNVYADSLPNSSDDGKSAVSHTRRYDQVKDRIHTLLDEPDRGDRIAVLVQVIIAGAIILNTIAIILFTVRPLSEQYSYFLNPVIAFCLLIFTAEYVLRIWSCTCARDLKGMVFDRIRYALHLYQIVDLISIVPALFPFLFPRHLALLRTLRIISIFKMGRYSRYLNSLNQLKQVLFRKREVFGIMLFFLVFVILFSSTIIYLVENPAQPDTFSSIPAAMWWAIMTVTTVGYGDMIPITPLGKIIGCVMTLTGVLVLALPSAILAAGFIEEREKARVLSSNPSLPAVQTILLTRFEDLHKKGFLSDLEFEEYEMMIKSLDDKKR